MKVTQIAFPENVIAAVYATGVYASKGQNPTSNASRHGVRGQPLVGTGHDHGRRHHERVHGGIHGGNQRIRKIDRRRPPAACQPRGYDVTGGAARAEPGGPLAEPVPAPVTAAVAEPRTQPAQSTPRILVVEDDAKMRRVLELLLSGHWTVETAADARSAIVAMRERPPDLVLTDLLLPGMDGYDFLRQLRAEAGTRTLPVIVISGLTEEADRLKALEAGANDYLIKPFSERELMLRVTTHLEMGFLRREAALRESEAQVRAIIEGALDAVVGMDASGLVIDWNQQAEATFGYTREEAMGRRLAELIIPPELREPHERGLERYFETGEGPLLNRRVEVEGQRKDGTRVPIELSITVVKGWGFYRFNAFARDISDRRAAEAERTRLLEEAREANRMKDEFLAMLSHELRTPLSAIVGWAHMLRTGGLDEATVARAIETIDRNAKVQNQLIEDILDVSRIVAGKFHLDMRSIDLVRIVEAACDTVAPTAAAKGVELQQDLDPRCRALLPRHRRPRSPAAGGVEPAHQRREVHAQGRHGDGRGAAPGRARPSSRSSSATPARASPPISFPTSSSASARRARGPGGTAAWAWASPSCATSSRATGARVMATSAGEGQGSAFTVRLPIVEAGEDGPRVQPLSREEAGLDEAPRLDGVRVLVVEDEAGRAPPAGRGPPEARGAGVHGRLGRGSAGGAGARAPGRPAQRHRAAGRRRVLADPQGARPAPGQGRADPGRRPHRLRAPGGPHARALRGVPAPRGQARGAGRARRRRGQPGREERAVIEFTENALSGAIPPWPRSSSARSRTRAPPSPARCAASRRKAPTREAPDRARIVIVEQDKVVEWTVALPAAPGDVARAARRALAGRRRQGERRRPARTSLDRRRT